MAGEVTKDPLALLDLKDLQGHLVLLERTEPRVSLDNQEILAPMVCLEDLE